VPPRREGEETTGIGFYSYLSQYKNFSIAMAACYGYLSICRRHISCGNDALHQSGEEVYIANQTLVNW
jgi:hypothetical protein